MPKVTTRKLLDSADATGSSKAATPWTPSQTFQARGTVSSGVGNATIKIEASNIEKPSVDGAGIPNDDTEWFEIGELSLPSLAPAATNDAIAIDAQYAHIRANITVLVGANPSIDIHHATTLGGG